MRLPTFNQVTLPYGYTDKPYSVSNPHAGTDFSWSPDECWYAPEPCIVTVVTSGSDCGKQVDLRSLDGQRTYRGCHSEAIYVTQGQQLAEGQKIALIGATGYADGRHLHFIMWVNGARVNCEDYLKEGEEEYMVTDKNNLKYLYLGVYAQDVPDDQLANDGYIGADMGWVTMQVLDYANKNGFAYWQYKPQAEKQIADLTKEKDLAVVSAQAMKDQLTASTERVGTLTKENVALKAEIAATSEDTKNLNSFGALLQWLIKRLGLSQK